MTVKASNAIVTQLLCCSFIGVCMVNVELSYNSSDRLATKSSRSMPQLTPEVSDRHWRAGLSVNVAPELPPGAERRSGAAVRWGALVRNHHVERCLPVC
jgi:hypothetical protein